MMPQRDGASDSAPRDEVGPWVGTVEELVAHVNDGDAVSVGGFHFVRAPMAQLRSLMNRSGVSNLTYVAWGGGLPLELLLAADMVRKFVFCFSSLDIFGLAPRFRRALENGSVEHEEWTALSLVKGLEAAAQGIGVEVLPEPTGSQVYPAGTPRMPALAQGDGPPLVSVPAIRVDAFLLHAQRADDAGNVEIAGGRGLDISTAFAARRVLVTVEERVPTGELCDQRSFVLPRSFVTAIALAPSGARPTSCLPYYAADFSAIRSFAQADLSTPAQDLLPVSTHDGNDSVLANIARRRVPRRAVLREYAKAGDGGAETYTVDELMVCLLAREVSDASICSVGSVSPLATTAYLLAKRMHARQCCVISNNGGYVDVEFRPMCLLAAEALDYASSVVFAGGDETYHRYYQKGLVTHEVVSAAQVDRRGATNNVRLTRADGSVVRLPGQGGMADVANLHANFMLYLARHDPRSLVEAVEVVSAVRAWTEAERSQYGLRPGYVGLLTNLARFRLDPSVGELVLTHLHPGVSVEEVQRQTGFPLRIAEAVRESTPPSVEELRVLRTEVDPLGVRRLEFVKSANRAQLIDELFAKEDRVLGALRARRADENANP